jgi:hypothetical protein
LLRRIPSLFLLILPIPWFFDLVFPTTEKEDEEEQEQEQEEEKT